MGFWCEQKITKNENKQINKVGIKVVKTEKRKESCRVYDSVVDMVYTASFSAVRLRFRPLC